MNYNYLVKVRNRNLFIKILRGAEYLW